MRRYVARSNCHLEAWRALRSGHAVGICLRPTRFSKLATIAGHPLWWPLRLLGGIVQWTCWPLVHIGELLRSGRWYHVYWIDRQGRKWEFVMTDENDGFDSITRAFFPPLIFRGRVQSVEKEWE